MWLLTAVLGVALIAIVALAINSVRVTGQRDQARRDLHREQHLHARTRIRLTDALTSAPDPATLPAIPEPDPKHRRLAVVRNPGDAVKAIAGILTGTAVWRWLTEHRRVATIAAGGALSATTIAASGVLLLPHESGENGTERFPTPPAPTPALRTPAPAPTTSPRPPEPTPPGRPVSTPAATPTADGPAGMVSDRPKPRTDRSLPRRAEPKPEPTTTTAPPTASPPRPTPAPAPTPTASTEPPDDEDNEDDGDKDQDDNRDDGTEESSASDCLIILDADLLIDLDVELLCTVETG